MLAADANLEALLGRTPLAHRHLDETSDARDIDALERIDLEDALVEVVTEEAGRIVARDAHRHLREVVRAEAEEVRDFSDGPRRECGARHLDHGAHRVGDLATRPR